MAKTILRRIWNRLFLLALFFWLLVLLGYGIAFNAVWLMPGRSWWHILVVSISLQGSINQSWGWVKSAWRDTRPQGDHV